MHWITKQPIRRKLFFCFAAVLLLNLLVTLLFGNHMMEQLYSNQKNADLKSAYNRIVEALAKQEDSFSLDQTLQDAIYQTEKENINLMLLTVKEQQAYVQYFSRENWLTNKIKSDVPFQPKQNKEHTDIQDPFRSDPETWISDAVREGVFQTATLPLLVSHDSKQEQPPHHTIDFYGKVNQNGESIYIFLRTPQEPISLAAALAVRYNLFLSLLSFFVLAAMSYFAARHITKPIEQIRLATQRIREMNFSETCQIHTGDELESLSGDINAMAVKLQDYIYQLQLNQELLEKDLKREAKTNALRQEFIANVSHDFKTPLTLIRAYTETLSNVACTPEEQQQYYQIILTETDRMNRLVTQLLQLSKLESGIVQLESSYFPMEELLRDIVYRNQLFIQKKELQIVWDCESTDHIVQGDYARIEQALINLLENAMKYTAPHGTIHIQVHTLSPMLCQIAITNTCDPLTEEQIEHLFISFYKTDESRHLEQQSFGLGLAIVKATMNLHHQSCVAKNTPDGLQISFTLPMLPPDPEEEDEEEPEYGENDL